MSISSAASSTLEPILIIDHTFDRITVIERCDVPTNQQATAIEDAIAHIARRWKHDQAFVGAMLLRGRNRGGLACYAQWKQPPHVIPTVPAAFPSLADALPGFTLLDSRSYTVEFTNQAEAVAPPTRVSVQQTPLVHFGIFRVTREKQDELLDRARTYAPQSLTTPGLLTINFHRSIDGVEVINMGTWTTFDHFQALLQRPGFRDDNVYWEGVADFQPDFFDVVAVEVGA